MFTLLISLLVIIGIGWYASSRKAGQVCTEKPSKIKSFTTELMPNEVMKTIVSFANQSNYMIAELSEAQDRIILSEGMSLTSYGFFYPIYLSRTESNATIIEIGIKSKAKQVGPVVNHKHDKIFTGIKNAVLAHQAS